MKYTFSLILGLAFLSSCAHQSASDKKNVSTPAGKAQGFDATLSQYSYPFEVKTFEFDDQKQKLSMAYMDIPAGKDTQKTIVLFHGKNFSGAYFHELILGLNQEGYRVIVPDQIGFGKSSKPQHYQYSFQALAENTAKLLNSLNIKEHSLLGHSMGGMLAVRYSLMYPERVKKLFLVNPIGLEDYKSLTSYRNINEGYQTELSQTEKSLRDYQLTFYYDNKWKDDYNRWLEIPVGWINGPDKELIAWNSALTADMIFTQPVVYELNKIRTPTVLIIGTRDTTAIGKAWAPEQNKRRMGDYKALGKATAKAIPRAKLIELGGLGHLPFVENFELFWKRFSKEIQ